MGNTEPGVNGRNNDALPQSGFEVTRVAKPGAVPSLGDRPTFAMDMVLPPRPERGDSVVSAGFFLPDDQVGGNSVGTAARVAAQMQTEPGVNEREDTGTEFMDPLESGRTIREYSALLANLDENLIGSNVDQVRMILNELEAHLFLIRPEQVRKILEACPLLDRPGDLLKLLEEKYPSSAEVLPGLSKFQTAIRELGRSLVSVFKSSGFENGIESLVALTKGEFKYKFIDFRESLLRVDNEQPQFTGELAYWLRKLTQLEKDVIMKTWTMPLPVEKLAQHLCGKYPPKYHTYVLQVFAERLSSLFAHSSIPDNASPEAYEEDVPHGRFVQEVKNLAIIWNGKLPLPAELPDMIAGRVTDRVKGTGVFDPEDVGEQGIA
ncbi:hypothetical protein KAZ92_01590 [Candidatus Gracilibacteria bacterium]|nr:hypothetical protein [Candidatus Gracilibacteria bacterium]